MNRKCIALFKYLDISGYGTLSDWMVSFTASYSFKKIFSWIFSTNSGQDIFFCGICGNLVVTTKGNNAYDPNGQG